MRSLAVCLVLHAVSAALPAQTFTSPKGYDAVEAAGSHGHVLGSIPGLRWQQLDASLRGTPVANLQSIAFRRDATLATNVVYGPRTLGQLSVVLAHANLAAISTDFGANYEGAPTTVFGPKDVSAPDWSAKPAMAPAAFDLKLTFDQTWSYNGSDDLLWEVVVGTVAPLPTVLVNYPFDFQAQSGAFESKADGVAVGTGCLAKGQASRRFWLGTTVYNRAASLGLRAAVNFGPPAAAIYAFLDVANANLTVPGLCGVLRAYPTLVLPLGTASSGGSAGSVSLDGIPIVAGAIGGTFYMQAFAFDDSQSGFQVAVSQGERLTVPGAPALPTVGRVHGYPVFGGNAVAGPFAGGVIAQFGY